MNIFNSFVITTLAGLSTIIGFLAIYIKGNTSKIISLFLSMSSGVMFIISIIDLIPSSLEYFNNYYILFRLLLLALFVVLGFILSNNLAHLADRYGNNSLAKLGILSLISIVLHNVFEGILTFMSCQIDLKLGISMALAISLHNIPEGISIAIPLYYANKSKRKIFFTVVIAGLSELLGALLAYLFLMPFINNFILGIILALTAGIMLNIGLFNLLKESFLYNRKTSIVGFILGILIMLFSMNFV